MAVILRGWRYKEPIEERCETVEDARLVALSWEPVHWSAVGFAASECIVDEAGNVLVSEKELGDWLSERAP
jgi:hypothetical protein